MADKDRTDTMTALVKEFTQMVTDRMPAGTAAIVVIIDGESRQSRMGLGNIDMANALSFMKYANENSPDGPVEKVVLAKRM